MKNVNLGNTHVPDKVYAYSLQVRHMMYELLDCKDGDAVSVEVFDDIGVERSDGTKEAIQAKSALSNRNPVSDRAVDLWKTLYNWLVAVQEKEIDIECTNCKLLITVDKHGNIVDSFNNATTDEEACQAWETAKKEFYDEEEIEKKMGNEYADYIQEFFSNKNRSDACSIIRKFKLETLTKNHTESLYERFQEKVYIAKSSLDMIFIYMLGWIDKQTAELAEDRKPMVIYSKNFRNELTAKYREVNQKLSLVEIAPKPSKDMINNELDAFRVYIEQLDIVNCDYTDKIEAVSDYLRASANRTAWAEKGDISKDAVSLFSEELVRIWKNKKKILDITQKNSEESERGLLLYFECKDKQVDMGSFVAPSFFTSGCFHALADDKSIGWHPEYKKILEERRGRNGESL
ncbi:ABC-three component system protein [Clostridium tyrobutyricum]|jgi:hypothetical protein|uniref:ABC-three component system protein n=1 Tax=Clostridium tyrobutyricum TaxID=1519 RepID=UPI0002F77792|nr:ABC-three component system protein [Clostridium tyrobutyricum]MEA5008172.1 ABC-three component system protein [Clostridium tyrobutyricum]